MFFEYKVTYVPDWKYENPFSSGRGLLYASNYAEATSKLIKYFGEENLVDIYLQAWDCDNCASLEEIKEGFKLT